MAVGRENNFIATQKQLNALCRRLEGAPYLAVDTEFVSEGVYRPKLCLIQLGYGEDFAVVDTLCDLDLSPIWRLFEDPKTVKVLHACECDLQIFYDEAGVLPQPLFDTQIAASVCGYGAQAGFSRLADSLCGIRIDKTQQMTDWSHRPLGRRQVNYALNDVVYLCPIFEKLSLMLQKSGRQSWVIEEMAEYLDEDRYRSDPWEAYQRVKITRPTARQLGILKHLAHWRETQAERQNKPRNWIMKDVALSELAKHEPRRLADLSRIRMLPKPYDRGSKARLMLDLVRKGLEMPDSERPVPPQQKRHVEVDEEAIALLSALLKLCADEESVAAKMIATRSDLEGFVRKPKGRHLFTRGWRNKIFGAEALELLEGRLALTLKKGKIQRIKLDK